MDQQQRRLGELLSCARDLLRYLEQVPPGALESGDRKPLVTLSARLLEYLDLPRPPPSKRW